ncbi:hypothetical protein OH77DRAFT_269333 [Trametes cingulata]|nr:hypothetical protein OH77DRAFT_269333 [Trametes cingulata]
MRLVLFVAIGIRSPSEAMDVALARVPVCLGHQSADRFVAQDGADYLDVAVNRAPLILSRGGRCGGKSVPTLFRSHSVFLGPGPSITAVPHHTSSRSTGRQSRSQLRTESACLGGMLCSRMTANGVLSLGRIIAGLWNTSVIRPRGRLAGIKCVLFR